MDIIFLNSPWIDIKEIQHLHEKRSKHRLPVSQPTFHHPLSSNSDLAKEEIDSVREKESSRRLLIDFSFQQSLRPLYSIYRSSTVASRILGRAKIWKNLNLMKSIHFNFPIFSKLSSIKSSIKSDRLFEKPVISRYKGLARKGSPVYFQFTAFLFHGEEGNTSLFGRFCLAKQFPEFHISRERRRRRRKTIIRSKRRQQERRLPSSDSYFISSEF